MEIIAAIKAAWPYAIVAAPGVWALWKVWVEGKKASRKERADLIQIAQQAAAAVIKDLRDEADRLRERVEELEGEVTELRKEHADSIAAKDAELSLVRGHLRQAHATLEAYERLLTQHDIPHEKPTMPYWRVAAGDYPVELG